MPQRADGACIHLDEDNTCKIYETRPDACRVDVMAEKNGHSLGKNILEYFEYSNGFCNKWIKEDGMDSKYLIEIGKYGSNTS